MARTGAGRVERGTVAARTRRGPWILLAIAVAAVGPGCRGKSEPADAHAAARRYTVRGEIVKLPPPQLVLRHEPIDDFVSAEGKVVGMSSMAMPFDVGPGASLQGIAPGDKVEAVLAVDYSHPSATVESLRKLPPDTALRFGPARPPPAGGAPR